MPKRLSGSINTIANWISLSRAVCAIPIVISIRYESILFYPLVLYAVVSDLLDGYVARSTNAVSKFGKMLDPAADFMVVMSVLSYLTHKHIIPEWYWWFNFYRYASIGGCGFYLWYYYEFASSANILGKISIIMIVLYGLSIIFGLGNITLVLLMLAIFFQSTSWLQYLYEFHTNLIQCKDGSN